jgi:hydroxymethylpyrimidine kinase/phosphomethylpyrimidine kinase
MLGRAPIVEVVARCLARTDAPVVVDPVLVATSGDRLLDDAGLAALCSLLLPRATLVTPNLREAEVLAGRPVADRAAMRDAARAIRALGARAVLVKGGHLAGDACDVLLEGDVVHELSAPRIAVDRLHGSGCTLSAAIAAELARGAPLVDAVGAAKDYVRRAIAGALVVGAGARPLDHRVPARTRTDA